MGRIHRKIGRCRRSREVVNRLLVVIGLVTVVSNVFQLFRAARTTNVLPWNAKHLHTPKLHRNESLKRKALIILTSHRSGSTFFGQFFNQRSDVLYLYEPLVPFGFNCSEAKEKKKVRHLADLVHCNIRDQQLVMSDIHLELGGRPTEFVADHCLTNNICFREKSKVFCSESYCTRGKPEPCWNCERVDTKRASHLCMKSKLVAIKVIRLCDLTYLRPLFDDRELDIKVIHLVRDPRGIYGSRSNLGKKEYNRDWDGESIDATCRSVKRNLNIGLGNRYSWLRGRYKVVRFEDMCKQPVLTASEVYQFVGLEMTEEMREWINANTMGEISNLQETRGYKIMRRKKKFPDEIQLKQKVMSDPYTTTRNSSDVWQAWRKSMNSSSIRATQSVCRYVLKTLNYQPIRKVHQITDSKYQVVRAWCLDVTLPSCRGL